MATELTNTEDSKDQITITTEQLKDSIRETFGRKYSPDSKVYGVPRGGYNIALIIEMLGLGYVVDSADQADVIVDDVIESGVTRDQYVDKYGKLFYAVYSKTKSDPWIIFPWEQSKMEDAKNNVVRMLELIGEDPTREGLLETPARVVRSWDKLYGGYKQDPEHVMKTFVDGACRDMVILKDIAYYSTCEHHLLPFFGKVSVGYIPNGRVIGVSKLARLVEIYARRLQIQERMCSQIADAVVTYLNPHGVMVLCEGQHFCMTARGVEKQDAVMVTSSVHGSFVEEKVRNEFLHLIGK